MVKKRLQRPVLGSQQHCSGEHRAVQGQSQPDGGDGPGDFQDGVNTHVKSKAVNDAFKFLIDFIGNEAQADMRFNPPLREVEYRSGLNCPFGYAESTLENQSPLYWATTPDFITFNASSKVMKSGGKPEVYRQRFLVAEKDGYITVPVSEISYISAESGLARIYLKNERQYHIDMALDDIDTQLDPLQFFRATRRHIVNISSVRRISNWFNRKIRIILTEYPDAEIVVGKDKVTRLKQWLDR